MNGNLVTISFAVVAIIILPMLASLCASYVGNKAQSDLVNEWGFHSQQWLGGLGTIIHECGHLMMAIIFNHHINSVKFLRLRHLQSHNTLGYVTDSYDTHSWYQIAGNFLIGIAPFYSCSTVLYLLHKWLLHSSLALQQKPTASTSAISYISSNVWSNLKDCWLAGFSYPGRAVIFGVLMVMISTTGFALSHADKHSMMLGLIPWSVFWILLAFVISFWANTPANFNYYIWEFMIFSLFMAINSILYILVSMWILKGCKYIIASGLLKKALYKPIH